VPARLRVAVAHKGDGWNAETEDLGPGGCLLLSHRALAAGARLRLAIESDGLGDRLSVLGQVAWARRDPRLRAGIAFDVRQPGAVDPNVWFEKLLAARPGIAAHLARVPDRLALDEPIFLLPPPRLILDIALEEAEVLARIDSGATPARILEASPGDEERVTRVLFSLFEKNVLTLSLGRSVPAWQWREVIAGILGPGPAAPPALPPSSAGPARDQPAAVPPPGAQRAQSRTPAPRPPGPVDDPPSVARAQPPRPPAARSATGSLRAVSGARPPAAQECFDHAKTAAAQGNLSTAIALLRRALQLSPRDSEIAGFLGQLAFKGRGTQDPTHKP
jgi:hypothetical protein